MTVYVYISCDYGDTWSVSPPFGCLDLATLWLEGAEMGCFMTKKDFTFKIIQL